MDCTGERKYRKNGCVDGWMIDRQVNRWIVRRYGWTVRVDGWVDVIYKQVDLMIDRWMDG